LFGNSGFSAIEVSLVGNSRNISVSYQISSAYFNENQAMNSKLTTSKDVFNGRWLEVAKDGQEIYSMWIGLNNSDMLKTRKKHWEYTEAGRVARGFLDK